jgi:hypothetical protein
MRYIKQICWRGLPTAYVCSMAIVTLGAADAGEDLRFEYEGIDDASVSMRCVSLGAP